MRIWKMSGEVEDVYPLSGTVSVWVQGEKDVTEIAIPDSMPEWLLYPGTSFLASIPWEQKDETNIKNIKWIDFEPLDYGYMSEEEIIKELQT